MLGGLGGFHLTALGTRAQTIPSFHHILHCGLSWKEGKRAGSTLSFPFTLPHQCKWERQSCILSLPPSSRMVANARAAQLGCVPATEVPWFTKYKYQVQLLHTLSAPNATNLAFHLEEYLQRSSWRHSPVSSGEVRGIPESEVKGCTFSVLAVNELGDMSLVLSLCRHPLRPQSEQPQPQSPFFLTQHHGYRWSGNTVTEGVPRLLTAEMYTKAHILTFPRAGKGEGRILTSVA